MKYYFRYFGANLKYTDYVCVFPDDKWVYYHNGCWKYPYSEQTFTESFNTVHEKKAPMPLKLVKLKGMEYHEV